MSMCVYFIFYYVYFSSDVKWSAHREFNKCALSNPITLTLGNVQNNKI